MTAINSAPSAKPWVKKTNRVQRTWPAWLISIFAAGISIVSILLSIQQSSGAFQVRKEIRQDLASFISTLQSTLLKAEVDPVVSIDYEMEQVKEFFNSSTLLFVASYYCESDKSIFEMSWIDFVSHIRDVLKYNDEMDWERVRNTANVLWNRLLLLDNYDIDEIEQSISSYPRYLRCVASELYPDFFEPPD